MFQYLIFVIVGIILYLLLNRNDGFSVGGEEDITCQYFWETIKWMNNITAPWTMVVNSLINCLAEKGS